MIKTQPTFNRSRLKALREMKGLTAEAAGKSIGRTGRSWLNWEEGRTTPSAGDLDKIALAFSVKATAFWGAL